MAKIANAAYFPAGSITIGTDEYTAAIDSAVVTPTTTVTPVTDISGQTTHVTGVPIWAVALSVVQDVVTANSLSKFLISNAGTKKTLIYTPKTGGAGFTLTVNIVPASIGGAGGQIAKSQVTLAADGQPVFS